MRLSDFAGHGVFALKRFELSSFETVYEQLSGAELLIENDIAVSDTNTALALVTAGVGITFLPEWVSAMATNGVVTRVVDDMSVEISMAVGWNPDCPVPGILPLSSSRRWLRKTSFQRENSGAYKILNERRMPLSGGIPFNSLISPTAVS